MQLLFLKGHLLNHLIYFFFQTNVVNESSDQIKRELSLDLDGSKMSVDDGSLSSINKHIINIPSTPNTPNFTHTSGNTSQSMTPSEFGYHHLNRQSADVSPKSPTTNIYEQIEKSFSSYIAGDSSNRFLITPNPPTPKLNSPLKSTINIIFKSPIKKVSNDDATYISDNNGDGNDISVDSTVQSIDDASDYEFVNVMNDKKQRKPPLETSFDENMVYEQVKIFKSAVSEVNLLLDNGYVDEAINLEKNTDNIYTKDLIGNQIVPNIDMKHDTKKLDASNSEVNSNLTNQCESYNESVDSNKPKSFINNYDVPITDSDIHIQDSLELEIDQNISLYKNTDLPNPDCDYENVKMELPSYSTDSTAVDSILSVEPTTIAETKSSPFYENISKPSKLAVRQLANKFETSPVETMSPFDFSRPLAKKLDNNRNSPCMIRAKNNKPLHSSTKITRSLDENAFIREFGRIDQNVKISTQKLNEDLNAITNHTLNSSSRRMSLEFIRPKSLNPPKRLPYLSDNDNELCKYDNGHKATTAINSKIENYDSLSNYNMKITPTTENPISLIQHNVTMNISSNDKIFGDDEKKNALVGSVKVLGSFKLDRERIEKIKEERRHQLNEKFRSESFKSDNDYVKAKSKSKTELCDIKYTDKVDPLRYKSKSRGDVRNIRDLADCTPLDIIKSLGLQQSGGRMRRISDEKNQNDCNDYIIDGTTTTKSFDIRDKFETTTTIKGRRFDRKEVETHRDRDKILSGNKSINTKNSTQ